MNVCSSGKGEKETGKCLRVGKGLTVRGRAGGIRQEDNVALFSENGRVPAGGPRFLFGVSSAHCGRTADCSLPKIPADRRGPTLPKDIWYLSRKRTA